MAGVLTPQTGYELVKGIKENVSIPLEVHTHATSGIAEMTYLKVKEKHFNSEIHWLVRLFKTILKN